MADEVCINLMALQTLMYMNPFDLTTELQI